MHIFQETLRIRLEQRPALFGPVMTRTVARHGFGITPVILAAVNTPTEVGDQEPQDRHVSFGHE